jgi:hypothetical protein
MYSPAAHGALTSAQALPSLVLENVPDAHALHWRLAISEPAADWPWPAGHVRHATQASLPSVALK